MTIRTAPQSSLAPYFSFHLSQQWQTDGAYQQSHPPPMNPLWKYKPWSKNLNQVLVPPHTRIVSNAFTILELRVFWSLHTRILQWWYSHFTPWQSHDANEWIVWLWSTWRKILEHLLTFLITLFAVGSNSNDDKMVWKTMFHFTIHASYPGKRQNCSYLPRTKCRSRASYRSHYCTTG